jgi:hypothetical protein
MRQQLNVSVVDVRRLQFLQMLDRLLTQAVRGPGPVIDLKQVRPILEALPLTSTEFGLAINRLANARHYQESGEYGAACYELRLLRRSLEQQRTYYARLNCRRWQALPLAAVLLYHAESVPVREDDPQVLRDRKRRPQRHRLPNGFPPAAATRRRDPGQPGEDVFFDPGTGRGLLAGVLPHPFRSPAVSSRGLCTFPHQRHHAGQGGEVVEHVVREFDGRLARQRPLTRSRVAALDFGLEFLAIIAKLGFAGFLTVGFVAAIGLTSGKSLINPMAVRLCGGFFVWSLVLISCATSRRACDVGRVPIDRGL